MFPDTWQTLEKEATMTKLLPRNTSVAWALAALALMTGWYASPALAADRVVLCEHFTATW